MSVTIDTIDTMPAAAADHAEARAAAPYTNPYLAGIGLGLVLLAAFVVMGRGLGASGAFKAFAAWFMSFVAPSWVHSHEFLGEYLAPGAVHPLKQWLFFEVVGVFAGALVSALFARRMRLSVERGSHVTALARLSFAFGGGALAAIGAALARGCTSGQALTGGALLNLGSWVFMLSVFAGGYGFAYFVRRQWR